MKPRMKWAIQAKCAAVFLACSAARVWAAGDEQATNRVVGAAEGTNAVARISAADTAKFVNRSVVVTGLVAEVNVAERLVRLNFEHPYPKQTFTAVIFAAKTNLFPKLTGLQGSTIEVSGKVADYRGRPEIVISETNQLRVVQGPAGGVAPAGK